MNFSISRAHCSFSEAGQTTSTRSTPSCLRIRCSNASMCLQVPSWLVAKSGQVQWFARRSSERICTRYRAGKCVLDWIECADQRPLPVWPADSDNGCTRTSERAFAIRSARASWAASASFPASPWPCV